MPSIKFPHVIEIELTNDCNLQCSFCPRTHVKRDIGYMDINLFKLFIDEISEYPISFLRIVGLGESTLHPQFDEMLQYASNKKIKLELTTNGNLFDNFSIRNIFNWDIDIIGVSVDGYDKDSYEKIRVGGNYNKLEEGLTQFYRAKKFTKRKSPMLVVRKVILKKDTTSQIKNYCNLWKEKSDQITFNTLYNIKPPKQLNTEAFHMCHKLFFTAHIRYDGSVIQCPHKFLFDKNDVIGNIKEKKLQEIWQTSDIINVRKQHQKGTYPQYCQMCMNTLMVKEGVKNNRKFNYSNNFIVNILDRFVSAS